jgi:hypothetical protein
MQEITPTLIPGRRQHRRPIWIPDPCSFRILDCSTNVDDGIPGSTTLFTADQMDDLHWFFRGFYIKRVAGVQKMVAIKFEKSFVDLGGFWLSYQERG